MHLRAKKSLASFLAEDIGKGDITSNLLPKKKISAKIISRQDGMIAGVQYAKELFTSKGCQVKVIKNDGSHVRLNDTVLTIMGTPQSVLSCERTALNLLSRMSGIATQTNLLVQKIKKVNSKVKLFSTRKTAPGLRYFDKEAVEIGGGHKHRLALDQMIMIKDNHLAVAGSVYPLLEKARKRYKQIEVEVENLHDAVVSAQGGATIIMLDNMSPKEILQVVSTLKKLGLRNKIKLEASGGIDSSNIQSYAKTGVDMISVGKITSSVQGLDLSLEVS